MNFIGIIPARYASTRFLPSRWHCWEENRLLNECMNKYTVYLMMYTWPLTTSASKLLLSRLVEKL